MSALVGEAPQAAARAPAAEGVRRFRVASPAIAVILGALTLALTVLYVPLASQARDGW